MKLILRIGLLRCRKTISPLRWGRERKKWGSIKLIYWHESRLQFVVSAAINEYNWPYLLLSLQTGILGSCASPSSRASLQYVYRYQPSDNKSVVYHSPVQLYIYSIQYFAVLTQFDLNTENIKWNEWRLIWIEHIPGRTRHWWHWRLVYPNAITICCFSKRRFDHLQ